MTTQDEKVRQFDADAQAGKRGRKTGQLTEESLTSKIEALDLHQRHVYAKTLETVDASSAAISAMRHSLLISLNTAKSRALKLNPDRMYECTTALMATESDFVIVAGVITRIK